MFPEFRTPQFEDWLTVYNRTKDQFTAAIVFSSDNEKILFKLFSEVDTIFQRIFSQPAKIDYDYPLRSSTFVREIRFLDKNEQIAALIYILSLCDSKNPDAQHVGKKLEEMWLVYKTTGTLPKTAEEIY